MSMGLNDRGLMSEINVTPLVDVMLVLLIIFMVTAPMMMQGEQVALPETESGPMSADDDNIVVTVDNDNNLYINDYKIGLPALKEKLAHIIKNKKDQKVFLRADKNVPYGLVVQVMAKIKEAGVLKLGVVTEPVKVSSDKPGVRYSESK